MQLRQDLAAGLSIFIISVPLFCLFAWLMKRGAKEEFTVHQKTSPLRSVYFYGIAFGGLVMAVVGVAMMVNVGLKTLLKVDTNTNGNQVVPTSALASDSIGANSLIACASKCDLTASDQDLLNQWKTDQTKYYQNQNSNIGAVANDFVTTIPLVLLGLPLFWYHFARIRRETSEPSKPTTV